jgi:cytochrome c biogenesis protein CcmG/thiol:disulfide interchange protein DsbE
MRLGFAAAAVAALAFVPGVVSARRHHDSPSTGLPAVPYAKPPPDSSFVTDAGPRRLASLVGRPVVLNFWATWCEPCRDEIGAFAELGKTYGDAVGLIAVSEDETPGAADAFLRAHDVRAISVDDPDRRIFSLYTVVPIPTTLVLAADGTVRYVSIGALDWNELRGAIARAGGASDLTLPGGFGTVGTDAGTPKP